MRRFDLAALGLLGLMGCQSPPVGSPAMLGASPDVDMEVIEAAVARALSRGRIDLGPPDPRLGAVLTVLPPRPGPLEGRSVAVPETYDIETSAEGCRLVPRDGGAPIILHGVACRPLR